MTRSVCFFGSANDAVPPAMLLAARDFGAACAEQGWRLVYGGSRKGLMAQAAAGALGAGGEVIGVMPQRLVARELAKRDCTELHIVDNMHERKRMMFERSDAFLILPGGLGTLDEAFEMITWKQLGLHDKTIVVLDADGYWRPFQTLVEHIVAHGFARPGALELGQRGVEGEGGVTDQVERASVPEAQADVGTDLLAQRDRLRVVVAVQVGDEEPADVGERVSCRPHRGLEEAARLGDRPAAVDQHQAVVGLHHVDVDRPQSVHRQRQRDPDDAGRDRPRTLLGPGEARVGADPGGCLGLVLGHAGIITGLNGARARGL